MKSELGEVDYQVEIKNSRIKKYETIQNEILRSQEEVQIANFLYLNNIDYEYEPCYKYNIEGAKKPYTPDFKITQNITGNKIQLKCTYDKAIDCTFTLQVLDNESNILSETTITIIM